MPSIVPKMPVQAEKGKVPPKKGRKGARGAKPPAPRSKSKMPMRPPSMPPPPVPMGESMAPPFQKLSSAGRRAAV